MATLNLRELIRVRMAQPRFLGVRLVAGADGESVAHTDSDVDEYMRIFAQFCLPKLR